MEDYQAKGKDKILTINKKEYLLNDKKQFMEGLKIKVVEYWIKHYYERSRVIPIQNKIFLRTIFVIILSLIQKYGSKKIRSIHMNFICFINLLMNRKQEQYQLEKSSQENSLILIRIINFK